jgi:hypothetical protein
MYKVIKASSVSGFETKLNEAINDGYGVKEFTAVVGSGGIVWFIALVYQMEH